jgi:hypothetical protein
MLTSQMNIRNAWNDYFTGGPTLIQSKEYGTRPTLSGTSVHVSNCLFRSITSGSHGGALSITSVTYFLAESSSFFSCNSSSSYGGAIYFHNTNNGQCVFHGVCGYDCFANAHGQFSYVYVKNDATSKNYVIYSSISRCLNVNSNSYGIVHPVFGKVCCTSINVSKNKCKYRTGIYCNPYYDPNSVTCLLSYSTFADNYATSQICIYLCSSGLKHEIKSCNILRNTQVSSSDGIIYTSGNLVIEDSCILENSANYIFYSTSSSYTITLSKCTVDKTLNNGYLTIQNTVTKSFILTLNHMSTQNCHSDYDTPHPTKKVFCYCYTRKMNFYPARINIYF